MTFGGLFLVLYQQSASDYGYPIRLRANFESLPGSPQYGSIMQPQNFALLSPR